MKKFLENKVGIHPSPVAMVSSGNMENSNIATIAWAGILNSEPMIVYVSIRPSRFSNEIIRKTGEFVINLPNEKLVKEADFCGTKTGREIDKFKACNLTKGKSEKLDVPYIKECPINLECKVMDIQKFDSHDMFIAEVVGVHCDEEFLDEKGEIDFTKIGLLTFAGKKYFGLSQEVGSRGCAVK